MFFFNTEKVGCVKPFYYGRTFIFYAEDKTTSKNSDNDQKYSTSEISFEKALSLIHIVEPFSHIFNIF